MTGYENVHPFTGDHVVDMVLHRAGQEALRQGPACPNIDTLLAHTWAAEPDPIHAQPSARRLRVRSTPLVTAGIGGVAAFFASHVMLGTYAGAAILGGLWASVVFIMDRMLILQTTRGASWRRIVPVASMRLTMAIVLGSLVSIPLVLRGYQAETDGQLQSIHAQNLAADQQALDRDFADIGPMQVRLSQLQAVASGQVQPGTHLNPDVVAAQQQVKAATVAYETAEMQVIEKAAPSVAHCELDGGCGTQSGASGASAATYQQAQATATRAASSLRDALDRLDTAIANAPVTELDPATARYGHDVLAHKLDERQIERANLWREQNVNQARNTGLSIQLEVLGRLSTGDASVTRTRWFLLVLYPLIETLPILVKLRSRVRASRSR